MSLIILSSNGQQPNYFRNQFPNGIKLGVDSEVSVIGYSGQLIGSTTEEVFTIPIVSGENDTFILYHGDNAAGTTDDELYFQPQPIRIRPAVYTPRDLAGEIQTQLNLLDYVSTYRRGWVCTYDIATNKFFISCDRMTTPPAEDGDWIVYGDLEQPTSVINTPGVSDILDPTAGRTTAFLDLKSGFIGYTDELIGTPFTNKGWMWDIQYIGPNNLENTVVSYGLVMEQNATKCIRNQEGVPYHINGSYWSSSRSQSLVHQKTKVFNSNADFAIENDGQIAHIGYFAFGFAVDIDGRIGIIRNDVYGNTGNNIKQNRTIRWTAVNLTNNGNALKRFAIAPRWTPAGSRTALEFFFDDGTGFTSIDVISMTGSEVYDRKYLSANTERTRTLSLPNAGIDPVLGNPFEIVTLAWSPVQQTQLSNPSPQEIIYRSGFVKACQDANLRTTLGFMTQHVDSAVPSAAGTPFESDEGITSYTSTASNHESPILITIPELSAKSYIGAANGGGVEEPVVAVARVRGNTEFAFSADLGEDWIELNNAAPITLQNLTVVLKDTQNRLYQNLQPNFNLWLKFRSRQLNSVNKNNITVGNFDYQPVNNIL